MIKCASLRLGEAAPTEADHFTRGRNKRSLNSESEKGDEEASSKRGRNKGKKKRGPTPQIKKVSLTASRTSHFMLFLNFLSFSVVSLEDLAIGTRKTCSLRDVSTPQYNHSAICYSLVF